MKYIAPIYKGKPQWVPVCVKSKDVFVGYIETLNHLIQSFAEALKDVDDEKLNENFMYLISRSNVDSSRFNYVGYDGEDIRNVPIEDFEEEEKQKIKEQINSQNEHTENSGIEEDVIYQVDCECGNSVSFKTIDEIPDKDFNCWLCERVLIQYTGVYDHQIEVEREV